MNSKESEPLVSVLMPNYNNEQYLPEAIESILNQTYKNFEFIIVDDCSTDESWDIIQKYAKKDKRLRVFRNEKNLKIVKTRNKAFSLVSKDSKYCAIFDSDDISMPNRLEKQTEFMENNLDYSIVGGNIYIIDENSKKIGFRKYESDSKELEGVIYIKSPFAHPSIMIRKNALEKAGMKYSSEYEVCEDWELYFRLLKLGKIANLKEFLIKYRISTTQSKTSKLKLFITNGIKIKRKYAKENGYFSIKYFVRLVLEYGLMLVPSKIILILFKIMEYRK